jgi:hypothetical protein
MDNLDVGWAAFTAGAKPFSAQATAVWPTILYQIHSLRFKRASKGAEGHWGPVDRCGAELSLPAAWRRINEGYRGIDYRGQGYKWQINELPACAVESSDGIVVVTEDGAEPFANRVAPASTATLFAFARLVQNSRGYCYVVRSGLRPPRVAGRVLNLHTSDSDGIRFNVRWTTAPNHVRWEGVLAVVRGPTLS